MSLTPIGSHTFGGPDNTGLGQTKPPKRRRTPGPPSAMTPMGRKLTHTAVRVTAARAKVSARATVKTVAHGQTAKQRSASASNLAKGRRSLKAKGTTRKRK